MSYIDNNLMSGETVVAKARIHWFIYAPAVALILISLTTPHYGLDPIGAICFIIGLAMLARAVLERVATELGVTNKRVIAKHGLIVRNTIELNLNRVESLSVDQSIMGRIFDFGTVTVNGTGTAHAPFRFISQPLQFRRTVNEQVEQTTRS